MENGNWVCEIIINLFTHKINTPLFSVWCKVESDAKGNNSKPHTSVGGCMNISSNYLFEKWWMKKTKLYVKNSTFCKIKMKRHLNWYRVYNFDEFLFKESVVDVWKRKSATLFANIRMMKHLKNGFKWRVGKVIFKKTQIH